MNKPRLRLPRISNPLTELYDANQIAGRLRRDLSLLTVSVTIGMIFYNINSGALLAGFARELGADDFAYGILISVPMVCCVSQLFSSWLVEKTRKRKLLFIVFGIIARLMWLPVALTPFFVPMELAHLRIWVVIVFVSLAACCASFIDVGLVPWMSDLIPIRMRGQYLGVRSSFSTFSGLVGAIIGSLLLDRFTGLNSYCLILGIACFLGVADIACFIFITDTQPKEKWERPSMLNVAKRALGSPQYVRYVLFWLLWSLTSSLYGPYVNMYALGPLGFSMAQTTIFGQVVYAMSVVVMARWWGRQVDRHGAQWTIRRSATVLCSTALLWLFVDPARGPAFSNILFYFLYFMINGMVVCGIDVTSQQLLMTVTPQENRSMYLALYAIIINLGGNALGNMGGGWILTQLGDISFSFLGMVFDRYKIILLAGAALRLAAALILLPGLPRGDSEMQL